jgi:hypothetical protein
MESTTKTINLADAQRKIIKKDLDTLKLELEQSMLSLSNKINLIKLQCSKQQSNTNAT